MSTPHGNFRWNGTRWEAMSYTPPANAANPPPSIVYTNNTGAVASGSSAPNYFPSVYSGATTTTYVASLPPYPMIKQPEDDKGLVTEPSRTERDSSDVTTVRGQLWKQQLILEELGEGVSGADGQNLDDALYFLREALEALNKISE